ncbi:PREDICTED: protein CutA homolog [Ceratosolen solmsi marchali]|uniref:Protein CutA homolog n=1 Tax=Ceratosolen solmsi marchali TaxID=326594 RepID=A0AAJ7DVR0_9HYME|nr:PREDICTED: protein CutA homolog [Ceratosolen solmsi marchali]
MSNFAGIFSIVYVTIKTGEYASTLSRGLIEHKLAACINIIKNVKSIYKWDNSIVEDDEHLLMIKTRTDTVPALTQYVKEHHPYKVCEVISVPIRKYHRSIKEKQINLKLKIFFFFTK